MVILNFKMVNEQQSIQTSLLVIIIITLETFFFVGNIIPVRALHKEQQLLENYDDLQEFADVVKNGDEEIEDIPLQSMKASDIYDDADENMQDCIDLAAKVGDNLADKDVVHCVEDVNYFKNKLSSNSSVPTTTTTTSTTDTGTSASTGTNGTSSSNGISTADDEENNLINELMKTGKFTEDEAREFNLIHELMKTGKFTEDEAREFVTKAMKNGTNEANVPDEADVPEPNVTAKAPEPNVTAKAPEPNVTAKAPEPNVTAKAPEPNVTAKAPEANVPQDNNSDLVKLDVSVKQNPIAPGEEQTVTLIASDPITGEPLERIFVHLTIKDPSGNVVKDYTDNDGKLSPTFIISEDAVGTFTILGTALQAGVESSKSLTFQVQ
jgi:polyhydroxyalkanoate synthesis regulator phasin